MLYYYFPIFVSLFFCSLRYEIIKKKKGISLFIFIIIFIYGFTYKMGGDWPVYLEFYIKKNPQITFISFFSEVFLFEKGYVLLNLFFFKLGFSYFLTTSIEISICIFIWLNFLRKKTRNIYFAFIILLTTSFFTYVVHPVVRQMIAISIFLIAFKYIEKGKFFKYLLLVIIAAQFHRSAYICIFLYFFRYVKLNYKIIIFYSIGIYLVIYLLPLVIENIPGLSYYKREFLDILHTGVRKRSFFEEILKVIILSLRIFLVLNTYGKSKNKSESIENIAIVYLIISYFSNRLPMLERLQGYFVLFYIISFSFIGKIYLTKKLRLEFIGKILIALISIMLSLAFYRFIYSSEVNIFQFSQYRNYIIERLKGNINEDIYSDYKKYYEDVEKLHYKNKKEELKKFFN